MIDAIEKMRDFDLPYEKLIYFPISAGIIGDAFKNKKCVVFNDFNPKFNIYYVPEVDNMLALDPINNLLFCATTDYYG